MKKLMFRALLLSLILAIAITSAVGASEINYGAAATVTKTTFTINEMLTYAIQDEYLAREEYEQIITKYGSQTPYSNIIKAEVKHITTLKELFTLYKIAVPSDLSEKYITVPSTLTASYQAGIDAEIANIAMYKKFLAQKDLPSDVKSVFTSLMTASQSHLNAFQNALNRSTGTSQGRFSRRSGRN